MSITREGHTASVLTNGKVLVVGGSDNETNVLVTAELYDPSTGNWIITGNLQDTRVYHTASVLLDGKVLVTGGAIHTVIRNTCELYDPSTGNWTQINSMHYGRTAHTASLLLDGKLLVTGGGGVNEYEILNICELYDPSTGNWTKTHGMHYSRMCHTATMLTNGTVLVTNGLNSYLYFIITNSTELYNPLIGNWTITDPLKEERCLHTASLLPNEKVLVISGYNYRGPPFADSRNSTELYDPLTGKWENQSRLKTIRSYHATSVLKNGNILVIGGDLGNGFGFALATCELYNSTMKSI